MEFFVKIKDFFELLSQIEPIVIVFKFVLISILAGVVGYERESWKKPAGFRTYVLAGISGVLVMLCGTHLYEELGADPGRIPAQLISGIGFLGAGTILRDGFNVKGLTTAAGLLAITCIGLLVGEGFYYTAIIATIIVYIVLTFSHKISSSSTDFNFISLKISTISSPKDILPNIEKVLNKYELEIADIKLNEEDELAYIALNLKARAKLNINQIISEIIKIKTIIEVKEI